MESLVDLEPSYAVPTCKFERGSTRISIPLTIVVSDPLRSNLSGRRVMDSDGYVCRRLVVLRRRAVAFGTK